MIANKFKKHILLILTILFGAVVCAEVQTIAWPEDKAYIDALIKKVDQIKIPIDPKILEEYESEGNEGSFLIRLNSDDLQDLGKLKQGFRATLLGRREKPVAVIFYIKGGSDFYLIPFRDVEKLERPLRMSKVSNRFFKLESNRGGLGAVTDMVK